LVKRTSKWTALLIAFVAILLGGLLLIIIQTSGIFPAPRGVPQGDAGAVSPYQNLGALPWVAIVVTTTVILGAVLAYAQYRSSKVTPAERAASEAATRALHERERDPTFKD
jgi:hypothetical protein